MFKRINNALKQIVHRWLFTYQFDVQTDGYELNKKYDGDAGYDLRLTEDCKLMPRQIIDANTNVKIKSNGVKAWIRLIGRSSTLIKYNLIVDEGIIDDGYTGELLIKIYNPTNKKIVLKKGTRIGQFIIQPLTWGEFKSVEEFVVKEGERGEKGFGHTGV